MPPRPRYVGFHLTERCDARCLHCRIWQKPAEPEIGADLLCRAAQDVAEWLGPTEIQLAGGEPLLSSHLSALVRCGTEAGLAISLTTNGFCLEGETAHELAQAGLKFLVLSLDGFDRVHNRIRRREDAFALGQRAISHAYDNGIRVRLNCVICELNLEILPGFVDWVARDKRLDGIFFQALVQPLGEPPRERWWETEPLFPQNPARATEILAILRQMKNTGFPILNRETQLATFAAYFADPGEFAMARCQVGTFGITIEGSGIVKLCGRHDPLGNLAAGERLRDMVAGEKARAVREQMRQCRQNCHLLINCCFDEEATR